MNKAEFINAKNKCLFLRELLDFDSKFASPSTCEKLEWVHVVHFTAFFIQQFAAKMLMGFRDNRQNICSSGRRTSLKLEIAEDPFKETIKKLEELNELQLEIMQDCHYCVRFTSPGPLTESDYVSTSMKIAQTDDVLKNLYESINQLI